MDKKGHKERGRESIFRKLVEESGGDEPKGKWRGDNEETRKGEETRRERQRRGSRMEKTKKKKKEGKG